MTSPSGPGAYVLQDHYYFWRPRFVHAIVADNIS
jgi:hypothetical protein